MYKYNALDLNQCDETDTEKLRKNIPESFFALQPCAVLPQPMQPDEQVPVSAVFVVLHVQLLQDELLQPKVSGCSIQHECQSSSHQIHEYVGWKQQTTD